MIRISNVRRDPVEGYWRARVHFNGDFMDVDRRYGSWQRHVRNGGSFDLLPEVAEALQLRARRLERAEKRTGGDET